MPPLRCCGYRGLARDVRTCRLTGTIGFYACYWFVWKIFSAIKVADAGGEAILLSQVSLVEFGGRGLVDVVDWGAEPGVDHHDRVEQGCFFVVNLGEMPQPQLAELLG